MPVLQRAWDTYWLWADNIRPMGINNYPDDVCQSQACAIFQLPMVWPALSKLIATFTIGSP